MYILTLYLYFKYNKLQSNPCLQFIFTGWLVRIDIDVPVRRYQACRKNTFWRRRFYFFFLNSWLVFLYISFVFDRSFQIEKQRNSVWIFYPWKKKLYRSYIISNLVYDSVLWEFSLKCEESSAICDLRTCKQTEFPKDDFHLYTDIMSTFTPREYLLFLECDI